MRSLDTSALLSEIYSRGHMITQLQQRVGRQRKIIRECHEEAKRLRRELDIYARQRRERDAIRAQIDKITATVQLVKADNIKLRDRNVELEVLLQMKDL